MSSQQHQPAQKRDINNPTCRFTGVDLIGTISIHEGGSSGRSHEEVPMAYAEYYRRRQSDEDSIPHAPGMTVTPVYRASLPNDELVKAKALRFTDRDDLTDEDREAMEELRAAGWVFQWNPNDRAEFATDDWCEPIKPYDE